MRRVGSRVTSLAIVIQVLIDACCIDLFSNAAGMCCTAHEMLQESANNVCFSSFHTQFLFLCILINVGLCNANGLDVYLITWFGNI